MRINRFHFVGLYYLRGLINSLTQCKNLIRKAFKISTGATEEEPMHGHVAMGEESWDKNCPRFHNYLAI